jgi:hypothetical protein
MVGNMQMLYTSSWQHCEGKGQIKIKVEITALIIYGMGGLVALNAEKLKQIP